MQIQGDTIAYLLEQLKSEGVTILVTSKEEEELPLSYTADGNAKWSSHGGKGV
jgi:hypothetical protein